MIDEFGVLENALGAIVSTVILVGLAMAWARVRSWRKNRNREAWAFAMDLGDSRTDSDEVIHRYNKKAARRQNRIPNQRPGRWVRPKQSDDTEDNRPNRL